MTNEELVKLYQSGDEKTMESIIEQNTGIVRKLAYKFNIKNNKSIDMEDLIQDGMIGIIIAAKKYDFNHEDKAQFITYAIHWINQRIHRYLKKNNKQDEKSLNSPVGDDGDSELMDYIEDMDYSFENMQEKQYIQHLRIDLEEVMGSNLTLKEQEVLKMRYGWYDNNPIKLDDIGELFNIGKESVRQTENRAIRKIRRSTWFKIEMEKRHREKKEEQYLCL